MKKIIAILATILTLSVMVSCGNRTTESTDAEVATDTTAVADTVVVEQVAE